MPADPTLPHTSAHHRDGSASYPCHAWQHPPGSDWGLEYGYCRTSLDWHGPGNPQGQGDPRCPSSCRHKAPQGVAMTFTKRLSWLGAREAARLAREHREARR